MKNPYKKLPKLSEELNKATVDDFVVASERHCKYILESYLEGELTYEQTSKLIYTILTNLKKKFNFDTTKHLAAFTELINLFEPMKEKARRKNGLPLWIENQTVQVAKILSRVEGYKTSRGATNSVYKFLSKYWDHFGIFIPESTIESWCSKAKAK